ncbi:YncE family protein [Pseudomonas rhodesiae]|uniref:YncE family protein n=3 Tax=Pseudomonas rhodesiae TaxID=76760 RepID=UPI001BCC1155|nr:YncE family protein [Pseudomonas rhodesiae]QVM99346.1 YncE family protein [Pseudomonas rhodesiae]
MSDTPLGPENDSISGGLPAASLPVPYQSPSLERPEPRRIEDLDHPYSAFPWVDLQLAAHPENAAYGLGIRHVRPYALFVFENWQNLNFLDYFAFYLEDLTFPVAEDYVWSSANPQQYLAIPSEFIPEGEVSSYGRVIRIGSGNESTSPVRTLLIKTDRPGGVDKDPGIPWHTGLVMRVEGFPEGSNIGAGDVVGGLWCLIDLYEHIRQNDVIELSWDGEFVQHTVSPAEAAGSGPIRVFVPKSIIDKGGQLGKVTLRFRVHDVVENFSGEKYQYSKPYFLGAELDPSLLGPPIFLVDGEELESRQIDFDTQSGSAFEVLVLTNRQFPTPSPRHQIIVTLLGMLEDGTTQPFVLGPVTDNNLGFTFVPVDASVIAQLVGGSFRVSFQWQTAAGVSLGQSGSITITVVGTKVLMPAPDVSPIELGLIPAGEDITVTLPFYEPHDPGWLETLFITHVPSGGGNAIVYRQNQLAGAQGGTYTVHAAELEQFNGLGHIDIYYETNDGVVHILGGNALATRRSLMLGAQIGERVADMPAPRLQGAVGNNVNPADVTGSDVLVTFTYLGTQPGDKLHWSCIGSGLGGSANGTLDINGATAGRELPYPVTRDILDKNNNGSLHITYSLERQGPPRVVLRSEALNLTVGVGVQLERPEVEEAQKFPDRLDPLAALSGATVLVKFRPMLATDQIRVDWISADGTGSVAVSAQGNPSTHEVKVPIPSEVIAKGIREGGNRISVQYHFTRGSFPYKSDVLDLELLPLTGLPTPTIDGVGDKVLLVLAELNDAARTRIPVWSFIAPNQRMWMIYTGIFANGSIYKEHTYTANLVTPNGVTHGIFPPTPVGKLRLLKDGSRLTIEFWVTLSESADINSAVLFGVREHTVQALASTLPAPAFDNRPGATLTIYPLDYEHTASVTVKYDGMNGEHVIRLKWLFPDGSEADIPAKNGLAGGRVDFAISQQILAASVGKTIELMYIAMINGSPVDSFEQRLTVQTIRESDLPRVLINAKANGDTLDLNTFTGNATAALAKWRLSITGQRVWITCSAPGVTPLEVLSAYDINSLEANNGLANKTVLRTWLAALPNNQEITVSCAVTFDGSTDRSKAVPFRPTAYIISTRSAGDYTDFESGMNDWIRGPGHAYANIVGNTGSKELAIHTSSLSRKEVIYKDINTSPGKRYRISVTAYKGFSYRYLALRVGSSTSAPTMVTSSTTISDTYTYIADASASSITRFAIINPYTNPSQYTIKDILIEEV